MKPFKDAMDDIPQQEDDPINNTELDIQGIAEDHVPMENPVPIEVEH